MRFCGEREREIDFVGLDGEEKQGGEVGRRERDNEPV